MVRPPQLAAAAGLAVASALIICALFTDALRRDSPSAGPLDDVVVPAEKDLPTIELAFAGDIHFEGEFSDVPRDPDSTLGPMSEVLREADLAVVNLESAITRRGAPTRKELEDPAARYWFRAGPGALDLLHRSGVDVVSVANNHGADFGLTGVRDTIRFADSSDVAVVGIGRNDREAYAPYRVRVRGTDVAIHAADASPLESADAIWSAAPGSGPGIATARGTGTDSLVAAVRASASTDDLVVVYLHWGDEGTMCSTPSQERIAKRLGEAGADIIVGSHAHHPLGAGVLDSAYVSYGLGNFFWYHGRQSDTGVLRLMASGGEVVGDEWVPAHIREAGGRPVPLTGEERTSAVRGWNKLRGCTDLAEGPFDEAKLVDTGQRDDPTGEQWPDFDSSISEIGLSVRRSMRSHEPATCPVPLGDLRYVQVTHVGFDGRAHRGELVVHAEVAADVVEIFTALYADRFPIERMLLVDEFGGDDNASMAANNTSGYNCRRVAGQATWSNHAFGRAIDINPVQNPYVVDGEPRPPSGRRFVSVDRTEGGAGLPGVIRDGDVVRREFAQFGWEWGGLFPEPDFQHFSVGAPH